MRRWVGVRGEGREGGGKVLIGFGVLELWLDGMDGWISCMETLNSSLIRIH